MTDISKTREMWIREAIKNNRPIYGDYQWVRDLLAMLDEARGKELP